MKQEIYLHDKRGASVYTGVCRDCVEIDTRRENIGERSKFGPSAILSFDQARQLAVWILAHVPDGGKQTVDVPRQVSTEPVGGGR